MQQSLGVDWLSVDQTKECPENAFVVSGVGIKLVKGTHEWWSMEEGALGEGDEFHLARVE